MQNLFPIFVVLEKRAVLAIMTLKTLIFRIERRSLFYIDRVRRRRTMTTFTTDIEQLGRLRHRNKTRIGSVACRMALLAICLLYTSDAADE